MTGDAYAVAVAGDTEVIKFVRSATHRLIFVAPAMTEEVARALCERAHSLVGGEATVIVDTDPEVYRLGYGDPASLPLLEEASNSTHLILRRQPGLRLCIVIADARTLIYAPTPRLIEAGPNTSGGANAIYLGPPPPALERDLSGGEDRPRVGAALLSAEDIDGVRRDLEANPPQKFDIARRMRVFNAYYEFVEIELSGVHIDRRQIRIPEHLMGVANEQTRARLRSHFQLVADDSKLSGEHLRKDRDLIARRFLKNVPTFGNLVRRSDKPKLQEAVSKLRESVEAFKVKLEAELQASIDRSRSDLIAALLPGVSRRPPKEWLSSDRGKLDRDSCRLFIEQDLTRAFGTASQWLSGMEVNLQFKGLTYETLNDKDFIAAAEKAGLEVERLHDEFDAAKASTPVQEGRQQRS
jgi:hypothetical protein